MINKTNHLNNQIDLQNDTLFEDIYYNKSTQGYKEIQFNNNHKMQIDK